MYMPHVVVGLSFDDRSLFTSPGQHRPDTSGISSGDVLYRGGVRDRPQLNAVLRAETVYTSEPDHTASLRAKAGGGSLRIESITGERHVHV